MSGLMQSTTSGRADLGAEGRSNAAIPLLEVRDFGLEFRTRSGTVHALADINLAIHKGETVGLVGESGSGKSVLSYAMLGISDPAARVTGGTAVFGGLDLLRASEAELADIRGREVSMIFQNPRTALNPIRKIGKQIEDVLKRHAAVPGSALRQRAIDALREVQIPDPERRYHAYPFELSGGMCQRVMIALALACKPALLVADEPTTGLDVTTQAGIMDLIKGLAAAHQMATLFITHDLGLAADHCDRIVVMHAGHVVEAAPVQTLFAAPRHPYTAQLIQATPAHDTRLERLSAIPGNLPDLRRADLPPCRFSERCPRASAQCAGALPRIDARDVQGVACWHPLEFLSPDRLGTTGTEDLQGAGMNPVLLETIGLSKRFLVGKTTKGPYLHAVDDVSMRIERGESVGLVGESGCGKSTLVRLVARLLDATEGSIVFNERDIGGLAARDFARRPERAKIQMVFQDPTDSLNPRYTAFDCIAEPVRLLGSQRGQSAAELGARVQALADSVGLAPELLSRFPHQLSGGQKARVGIARALGHRSGIVDPRRAVLGARRLGAGDHSAIAGALAARTWAVLSVRVARSECGAPAMRPCGGDVSRAGHRNRAGRGLVCQPASPLYAGTAVGDSWCRQ